MTWIRVFSKQTKKIFGSNRNKPKLNLFRLIFGLFRETTNFLFRFVSVFLTCFATKETNRSVSKQAQKNEKSNIKTRVSTKQTKKFSVRTEKTETHLFRLIFGLFRETKKKFMVPFVSVFRILIETTETNRSVLKQIEKKNKTRVGGGGDLAHKS
jgi:hypothetical protein